MSAGAKRKGFTTDEIPIRLRNGFGVTGGRKSQPGGEGSRSVDCQGQPEGHDTGAGACQLIWGFSSMQECRGRDSWRIEVTHLGPWGAEGGFPVDQNFLRSKIFLIRRRWHPFLTGSSCQQTHPWHRLPPD